jgi:protein-disulfide isomerase
MTGKATPGRNARDRAQQREEQARRRKRDRQILVVAAVALVVLLIGGGIGVQAWRTSRAPSATAVSGSSLDSAPVTVADGRPIVLGSSDAPVQITLYEDFHCPHCAEFEDSFGPTITAAQQAGTASVELYPMAFIDQGSATAANAMACAAEAGFGQAYYTGLFANHTLQWSNDQLLSLADQITQNATPESFTSCVRQEKHLSWVDSINSAADTAGVNQTPTMFIDGTDVDLTNLTVEKLNRLISDAAAK